jgi:hypothetical protein
MYKLHYAELNLEGDIPCFEFKTIQKLIKFIDEKTFNPINRNKVYLFVTEEQNHIFVTDKNIFLICRIIPLFKGDRIFFLQEYSSYEEAYAVALAMKEINPLCYEPDDNSK